MRSQSSTDVVSTNTATTLKYSRVKQSTSTKLPNYHNNMVAQRPKHLTPCPFLRRKGFCKKGDLCDFQHNNFKPIQSHPVRESQFSTPSLPHFPSSANQIPFPWNPNLFPPIPVPSTLDEGFHQTTHMLTDHNNLHHPARSLPNFLLSNVRSISNKVDDLDLVLQQNGVDFAGITETWLN